MVAKMPPTTASTPMTTAAIVPPPIRPPPFPVVPLPPLLPPSSEAAAGTPHLISPSSPSVLGRVSLCLGLERVEGVAGLEGRASGCPLVAPTSPPEVKGGEGGEGVVTGVLVEDDVVVVVVEVVCR